MRVVSLLPSATEIVYALGVEPVGVSHECDVPPAAAERPTMNSSAVDPDASSEAINEQVAAAEASGGVYRVDREALEAADPDVVVSQGVCDVCAVDASLVHEAVADLGLDCEVVTTHPHGLDDVFADVERIGRALDRQERAAELVADRRERVRTVRERAEAAETRPRVAVLDWMDPVMVAGHWIPEMVDLAGGTYGLADPGQRSEPREFAAIREYDPDVLVAAPCGFDLDQTARRAAELTGRDGYDDLSAVRDGRVYAMDGHGHVNRPGPRLVDTLEHLAGLVHPDLFDAPPGDVAAPLSGARVDAR